MMTSQAHGLLLRSTCHDEIDLTVSLGREIYGPRSCTVKDRARALCGNAGDDLLEDELFELGLER